MKDNRFNIPKGYRLVTSGSVEKDDLMWEGTTSEAWSPPAPGEIDSPVSSFKAVARERKS